MGLAIVSRCLPPKSKDAAVSRAECRVGSQGAMKRPAENKIKIPEAKKKKGKRPQKSIPKDLEERAIPVESHLSCMEAPSRTTIKTLDVLPCSQSAYDRLSGCLQTV